jgi:hypothetical protein
MKRGRWGRDSRMSDLLYSVLAGAASGILCTLVMARLKPAAFHLASSPDPAPDPAPEPEAEATGPAEPVAAARLS